MAKQNCYGFEDNINREKYYNDCKDKECRICGHHIYITDKFEIIKTRRKSLYMVHTSCILDAVTNRRDKQ